MRDSICILKSSCDRLRLCHGTFDWRSTNDENATLSAFQEPRLVLFENAGQGHLYVAFKRQVVHCKALLTEVKRRELLMRRCSKHRSQHHLFSNIFPSNRLAVSSNGLKRPGSGIESQLQQFLWMLLGGDLPRRAEPTGLILKIQSKPRLSEGEARLFKNRVPLVKEK